MKRFTSFYKFSRQVDFLFACRLDKFHVSYFSCLGDKWPGNRKWRIPLIWWKPSQVSGLSPLHNHIRLFNQEFACYPDVILLGKSRGRVSKASKYGRRIISPNTLFNSRMKEPNLIPIFPVMRIRMFLTVFGEWCETCSLYTTVLQCTV